MTKGLNTGPIGMERANHVSLHHILEPMSDNNTTGKVWYCTRSGAAKNSLEKEHVVLLDTGDHAAIDSRFRHGCRVALGMDPYDGMATVIGHDDKFNMWLQLDCDWNTYGESVSYFGEDKRTHDSLTDICHIRLDESSPVELLPESDTRLYFCPQLPWLVTLVMLYEC